MNSQSISISNEKKGQSTWRFLMNELKPRGKWLTWFNVISIPTIIVGIILIVIRFIYGIGAVTNLTQEVPWGLWIGLMW
ncbi:MAG: hypothetical protein IPF54_05705 [Draconibacterium sp.]|nr:hypothetical protein [Draconibacterium sp.]